MRTPASLDRHEIVRQIKNRRRVCPVQVPGNSRRRPRRSGHGIWVAPACGSSGCNSTLRSGRPTKPSSFARRLAVVADAATLRCTIEGMNWLSEFLAKLARRPPGSAARRRKCTAAVSAAAAFPPFHRTPGKTAAFREHRGFGPRQIIEHRARHPIAADRHRHAANQQRRDQVAEAVGMRQRDDREIQVRLGDSHRVANLPGIGEQLRAAETDRTRRGCRAGGEFEQDRLALLPIDRLAGGRAGRSVSPDRCISPATRQVCNAEARSSSLIVRSSGNDDDPPAQTGEKQGRPMRVIPDLNRNDFARLEILAASARPFRDVGSTPRSLRSERAPDAAGRKSPGSSRRRSSVSSQAASKRIFGFHHLRHAPSAATFPTLFPP